MAGVFNLEYVKEWRSKKKTNPILSLYFTILWYWFTTKQFKYVAVALIKIIIISLNDLYVSRTFEPVNTINIFIFFYSFAVMILSSVLEWENHYPKHVYMDGIPLWTLNIFVFSVHIYLYDLYKRLCWTVVLPHILINILLARYVEYIFLSFFSAFRFASMYVTLKFSHDFFHTQRK